MIKKYLTIGLTFTAVASVVFIVVVSKKDRTNQILTPKNPNITSSIKEDLQTTTTIEKKDFDFPSELPMISVSPKQLDRDTIKSISEKLGVGSELNQFEDINEGIKYYIDTDKFFFTATPKTSIIKFGMITMGIPKTPDKNITDQEISKLAKEFIVNNGFYKEDEIKALPTFYLKTGGGNEEVQKTSKSEAELYQVGFAIKNSKYEIVRDLNEGQQIYVQILPNGSIYSAEVFLINNIKESVSKYPIKTYEDFITNNSKSKIISLDGDYISPSDLTIKDLSNINIEKLRIAYYMESNKQENLQPIFIIEASVKIAKSSASFATMYLPAYK